MLIAAKEAAPSIAASSKSSKALARRPIDGMGRPLDVYPFFLVKPTCADSSSRPLYSLVIRQVLAL